MHWFKNRITRFSMISSALTAIAMGSAIFFMTKDEPIHLRWSVAHGPRYIVEAGVIEFQKELNRLAPGQFKVDFKIMTADDVKNQEENMRDQIRKVRNGDIEIAQVYTVMLSRFNPEFEVLDLPFLFENHSHAAAFMDGEVGQRLLVSLEKYDMMGLAFTYSGGYRVIATKHKEIATAKDFNGLSIAINGRADAKVIPATYTALNAKGVRVKKGDILEQLASEKIDGFETVYPRIVNHKEYKTIGVVNETMHSLHMTSLVMNKTFFANLPPHLQTVVIQAARKAALSERRVAVSEGEVAKQRLIRDGIKVVTWTPAAHESMTKIFSDFGNRFPEQFSSDLYRQIKQLPYSYRVATEE